MKRVLREIGFAFLAWAIPFTVAVCIFPIKKSNTPLFDSLMGVVLTTSTALLGLWYLKRVRERVVIRGFTVGIIWMLANWALDALMFSGGPMKMTFSQYASDIGVAYFMVPVITTGLAAAAARASNGKTRLGGTAECSPGQVSPV